MPDDQTATHIVSDKSTLAAALADPRPLTGRTALVTGGSRGIGAATVQALAGLGAHVVFTYRSARDTAENLARDCADAGGHATPIFADLASSTGAQHLLNSVDHMVEHVDIVVGNAGTPNTTQHLSELTGDRLAAKVAVDLAVAHQLATAFTPAMAARGYGRVILIGSTHAHGASAPGMAAHGITKAALQAWVAYAASDLAGPGVTINIVHPGYIATDTTAHLPATIPALVTALTPAGRLGRPDDVAGVVALLAHPAAGWLTGTAVPATGGLNHPDELSRVLRGRW